MASSHDHANSHKGFYQLLALSALSAGPTIYARCMQHDTYRMLQGVWHREFAKCLRRVFSVTNANSQIA